MRPLTHSRTGPTVVWEDCRKAYLPYTPGWNEWKWSQNGVKAKGRRRPTLAVACPHHGFNSCSSALKDDGNDLTRKERQWFSSYGDTEIKEKPLHSMLCGLEPAVEWVSGWLLWCRQLSPFIGSVKTNVLPCLMGPASYRIVQSNPNQGTMAK